MIRLATFVLLLAPAAILAQEPIKIADNKAEEPVAKDYSLSRAKEFMTSAALEWTRKRECFSCHTNVAFLYAQPGNDKNHGEIRTALEDLVTTRWPEKKPRWDAEVIVAAAALAYNDSKTTKTLSPTTKTALDRMWTTQRTDGGWSWLICGWPPMESDDHYGATLAALAVGVAPGDYAKTEAAVQGLAKIKNYLKENPPKNVHQKAMIVWAGTYLPDFVSSADKTAWLKELRDLQHKDGGWSAADIFPWKRGDKKEQTPEISDGYGAGFATFILRTAGAPKDDPAIVRSVAWLKSHQRDSGRWFTRSLFRDNKHYLSHAGTAFSIMALEMCE